MNIDDLARLATDELLERTAPAANERLVDLRRTRRQRNVARLTAAAVVLVLGVGAWLLARPADHEAPPAGPPSQVTNGALITSSGHGWRVVQGELRQLPSSAAPYTPLAFTPDGSEMVYGDTTGQLVAVDVTTGARRAIADCPDDFCDIALSPEGTRLVSVEDGELLVRDTGASESTRIPVPAADRVGSPQWSPDGRDIAFASDHGLYVVAADGSDLRLVHRREYSRATPLAPNWSPDGRTIAFLEAVPVEPDESLDDDTPQDTSFTVMTVRADGTAPARLHEAGHCFCLGLAPPAVAWSPDGRLLAVTISQRAGGPGVFTMKTDGSDWTLLLSGRFGGRIAWQPLPE